MLQVDLPPRAMPLLATPMTNDPSLGSGFAAAAPESAAPPALPPDEAALAARAQRGDHSAFTALYERFAGMVHAILIGMVRFEEAQDLAQEVFLKAWRSLGQLRDPARIGAWLATIARNRGRDALKRPRLVATGLPEAGTLAAPPQEPDEAGEILRLLRELPDAYRETLAMRLVEGMTGPEIARRTGLTHGSVRVNLTRGMKQLRERLQQAGWR